MRLTHRLLLTLATILLAISTFVVAVLPMHPGLALAADRHATDAPIDSRPCRANPSDATCNGVLPFGPHFSIFERAGGSGACFDDRRMLMEEQPIIDEHNSTIGTLQLWFFPSCQSYAAHLIFNPDGPRATISVQVQQFDQGGIGAAIASVFSWLGSEDNPLPSQTEQTGPAQDDEIWSPLLYSPTAPVQASATIDDAAHGALYGPLTGYYAAGQPTTINGKRY